MAKYEARLHGDFDDTLRYIHEGILNASMSASFEDESYFQSAGVRCCVRVYERYSFGGGNRVSLAMTLAGDGDKLNTWGDKAFLDPLRELVEKL